MTGNDDPDTGALRSGLRWLAGHPPLLVAVLLAIVLAGAAVRGPADFRGLAVAVIVLDALSLLVWALTQRRAGRQAPRPGHDVEVRAGLRSTIVSSRIGNRRRRSGATPGTTWTRVDARPFSKIDRSSIGNVEDE